ncbi:unnamed protein product [Euphydryas editha]|uniref:Uncharacterized protein n=1 Tax=Euphydryas editha TaxID=104508 RepID=A0AAU9U819_EUPED|nr:unnamed protein product [Euphydryas editha]
MNCSKVVWERLTKTTTKVNIAVILKFATKSNFCNFQVVKAAANLATIIFNDGYVALLDVVEELGISIGENLFNYCHEIDRKRIEDADRY